MTAAEVAERYRERSAWHAQQAERSRRRSERLSYLRLAVFLALLLALGWAATAALRARPIAFAAVVATAGLFAVLVSVHRRERRVLLRHEEARRYHELGVRRVERDWAALPPVPASSAPADHPYASDLDIVGRASIAQLLDVTTSAPGRPTLLAWLLAPARTAGEIRDRQAAVRELVAHVELREELGVLARLAGAVRSTTLDRFLEWCESPLWLLPRPALLWLARLITALILATLALQALGLLPRSFWVMAVMAGAVTLLSVQSKLAEAMRAAELRAATLEHHAAMLQRLLSTPFESPQLVRLQARLAAGGGAPRQLGRLERIMSFAEARHSPMLHFALQLLVLWDIHVVAALERWRREAGAHLRDWMAALGEAEALVALATLAYDNPGWSFPEIAEGVEQAALVIEARTLGHPLLPEARRVPNDVSVGPPGTFLLITGSNMSGKSTLLRAIGTNVVLAQAGAPVCAARFRTPLLDVRTSVRVQDSLEEGISLFMAELRRLKTIVDAARAAAPDRPVLFLLDEILHGTNTAERQIAARTVIGHLVRAGAIGAVTTHDLSLAAAGPIAAAARPVHFTERFDRSSGSPAMSFDYTLRPGLATSANALALLELVGLGE